MPSANVKCEDVLLSSLCEAFDRDTDDGRDMSEYTALLDRAIAAIGRGFQKRAVQSMLRDSNAVLPKQSEQPTSDGDFDLITWLVVRDGR